MNLRLCLAALLIVFFSSEANAIRFHFTPSAISISGRPGQVVTRTLKIKPIDLTEPVQFRVHMEDWWRSADNNRTFYREPGAIERSCAVWCSVNPAEAKVEPGEELLIRVTIRIPDDVKPGGYWGAITIDEVPHPLAPKPEGVAVVFRSSLSVGVFVEIPPVNRAARIVGVKVDSDRVAVNMQNDGDIPLRVNGWFEFIPIESDEPKAKVQIGGEVLLPEPINTCKFSAVLPDAIDLPSGKYKVRVIIDVGLEYLLGAENIVELLRPPRKE